MPALNPNTLIEQGKCYACFGASLVEIIKLALRNLIEEMFVSSFRYSPDSSVITWSDINGAGQTGDLATFLATANFPTVSTFSLNAKSLTLLRLGHDLTAITSFQASLNLLTTIDLGATTTLTSLNASLNTISSIDLTGNPLLLNINLSINALTTASVDQVLADVNAFGTSNGNLRLDLGNNASPTGGVSNADYIALVSRGWTVLINVATDWSNRVVANGGPTPSVATTAAMETFRLGVISAGLDTKMHSLCVFVPDSLIAATTPLFVGIGSDPWTNTAFVGADLTVEGLKGDAVTKFLDTGVMAKSGQAVNSITGNVGMTVVVTETDGNASGCTIGHQDGATAQLLLLTSGVFSASGETYFTTRGPAGGDNLNFTDWNRSGYISGNSVATVLSVYEATPLVTHHQAGTFSPVTTDATASNETIYCFATNLAGVASGFRALRMSMAAVHDGLTSAESSTFWSLISTLRTSLGGGTGDEVSNWSARVVSKGGSAPSANTQTALRTFYAGLVTDSLLDKMVAVNAIAPDNLTAAAMPLIWGAGLEQWTNINFVGGDLTVNGITGNLTTKSMDTGIISSSIVTGGFSSTSAGLTGLIYSNTGSINKYLIGAGGSGASSQFAIVPNETASAGVNVISYLWRFDTAPNFVNAAKPAPGATWPGYLSSNRTSATAMAVYGASIADSHSLLGSTSGAQTGSSASTFPISFMAINPAGVVTGWYDGTVSFIAIHAGLDITQSANYYARIATLRSSLGGGNP